MKRLYVALLAVALAGCGGDSSVDFDAAARACSGAAPFGGVFVEPTGIETPNGSLIISGVSVYGDEVALFTCRVDKDGKVASMVVDD